MPFIKENHRKKYKVRVKLLKYSHREFPKQKWCTTYLWMKKIGE